MLTRLVKCSFAILSFHSYNTSLYTSRLNIEHASLHFNLDLSVTNTIHRLRMKDSYRFVFTVEGRRVGGIGRRTATKIPFMYCIPFSGNARPQSQFLHSCVCDRFIYS